MLCRFTVYPFGLVSILHLTFVGKRMDLLLNYGQTTQHDRNIVIYHTIQNICLRNASSMKLHKK